MATSFYEELIWRRMLHDVTPGTDALLTKERTFGYIGFDPTADSLGVGNLVQVMMLLHFQQAGHKPIALLGGATGIVGDPSGKSDARNLLEQEALDRNLASQECQLRHLLDFSPGPYSAEIVNNYDWLKDIPFLHFIRDVGRRMSVNSMLAKDSVKNRIDKNGLSFTEFSYQLLQGYDFWWLWKHKGVKLQMGGSDQWGNIVTGIELIRRMEGGEACALTSPLLHKSDGTKFGKTERGNIWLDAARTTPYEFYQFWLNASDADAKNYIRVFTLFDREKIEALEIEHNAAPHMRGLQKALAKDITLRVHGQDELDLALAATEILFGKSTLEQLHLLQSERFESLFQSAGVTVANVPRETLSAGLPVVSLVTTHSQFLPSKGEARKLILGNGLSINKSVVTDAKATITTKHLINGRYVLLQKGKKEYCLVRFTS